MTVSFNGNQVTTGNFVLPRQGSWVAKITLESENNIAVNSKGILDINGTKYSGTVIESDGLTGTRTITLGAGNASTWFKQPQVKHWSQASMNTIIKDVFAQTNDAVAEIPSTVLNKFSTSKGDTLGAFLTRLCRAHAADLVWRQNKNGAFVLTTDNYSKITLDEIDATPDNISTYKIYNITTDDLPNIQPGQNINGINCGKIEYCFSFNSITVKIFKEGFDDISLLRKLINAGKEQGYFTRSWLCKVKSQNSSTYYCDLDPLDPQIKGFGLQNVKPRWGIPGSVKVNPGSIVLLSWENGDVTKPYYSTYENDSTTEIRLGSADDFVALSTPTNDNFEIIKDYLTNTIVVSTPVGPTSPGVVTPVPDLPSVAAQKVKAE